MAIAFGFFIVGIDRIPVPTVDGVVRASMARNMVESGQLWPIVYEGRIFADHPPLYIWLTALSYKIFGVSDFAANLVPRLFAFLTVLVTALIALQAGLSRGTALAAAFILCLTRDFVLSSVRGYIEPLLEFWIYAGVYFTLRYANTKSVINAAAAGVSVWLAAYSKGPVALWPFLFCLFFLRQARPLSAYLGGFAACTAIWAVWNEVNGHWPYWSRYLHEQVLGSALEGRGGAQRFEPFYFLDVLFKYYWPWLPLFVWSVYRAVRAKRLELRHAALVLALGFIGGFSLMKWKFWYYIAPAYPAMALLIAATFKDRLSRWFDRPGAAKKFSYAAFSWIIFASVVPIHLHRERVPEVMAFKETIVNSPVPGPVWFLHSSKDHNMIATSGEWYFDKRIVAKVDNEPAWAANKLKSPAWIMTDLEFFKSCKTEWCKRSELIQSVDKSALLYFK